MSRISYEACPEMFDEVNKKYLANLYEQCNKLLKDGAITDWKKAIKFVQKRHLAYRDYNPSLNPNDLSKVIDIISSTKEDIEKVYKDGELLDGKKADEFCTRD